MKYMDVHPMKILVNALLLTLCFSCAQTYAAKLYKIVGEDGKVTFSQFPPKDKQNETVEDISVKTGGATTVTKQGNQSYCGNILLPKKVTGRYASNLEFAERVSDRKNEWTYRLRRYEKRAAERSLQKQKTNRQYYSNEYATYKDKNYNQGLSNDIQNMRDLRCAIGWASNYREENSQVVSDLGAEKSRLEEIKAKLLDRIDYQCGDLPEYDPTDPVTTRKRKDWHSCSKSLRHQLKQVESKIRRL